MHISKHAPSYSARLQLASATSRFISPLTALVIILTILSCSPPQSATYSAMQPNSYTNDRPDSNKAIQPNQDQQPDRGYIAPKSMSIKEVNKDEFVKLIRGGGHIYLGHDGTHRYLVTILDDRVLFVPVKDVNLTTVREAERLFQEDEKKLPPKSPPRIKRSDEFLKWYKQANLVNK